MPTSVDLAQLKELLERGAQLVEVLPAAISLPVQQLDATSAARLDRGRPVVVYCSACCLAAWPSRPSTREQRRRLRQRAREGRRTWLAEADGDGAPGAVIVKATANPFAPARAAWVVQAMCCWASGAIRSRRCCGTGRPRGWLPRRRPCRAAVRLAPPAPCGRAGAGAGRCGAAGPPDRGNRRRPRPALRRRLRRGRPARAGRPAPRARRPPDVAARQRGAARRPALTRPRATTTDSSVAGGVRWRSVVREQLAPRSGHGRLEADLAHVNVRHVGGGALLAQLAAPPPDPGRGLAKL